MIVLVTGGTGTLGNALRLRWIDALAPTRLEVNLEQGNRIRGYLATHRPDVVVHAAAITDATRCERDRKKAWKVNVGGTESLFHAFREANPQGLFLLVSTAAVFPCTDGGYHEDSPTGPANYYGETKLGAEDILGREGNACIVRTNFVRRGKWPHDRAFIDRFGTYLYETGAARGIVDLVEAGVTGRVHVVGDQRISMFDLARRIDSGVRQISLSEWKGIRLPRDMSLISRRWRSYTLDE